ncbi:MAG: S46 family peptidase, partial [Bacteroidales bacterium]|nr:S46 family peptidase [Bacteroidales bacterium]
MKKTTILLSVLLLSLLPVRGDEGMWLLPLLEKMNSGKMTELGFEITPKQIYDLNNTSLKDAIVIFGGGCTGELVSNQGLLFTNHHCGYSNIQQLSSVEHNYLKDGYWAMRLDEELPCEGLSVRSLVSFTDVTKSVEKAMKRAKSEEEKEKAFEALQKELAEEAGCDGRYVVGNLTSFYGGNTFYFIVYKVFRDVRFVGAPPSSIGKFGADTDNWMWPRHTGDFSVFRVYADKNNNPADYSEENIPYTPENFLKISLKGYENGDPVMVMGYPGRTNRFMTSFELEETTRNNEIAIDMRTIRQDVLMKDMRSNPQIMIQYADKYSSSSNGWKKWIGMNETFETLNVQERRAAEEESFAQWVNDGGKKRVKRYGNALTDISESVNNRKDAYYMITYLTETVGRIELSSISARISHLVRRMSNAQTPEEKEKILSAIEGSIESFYKDYSLATDIKVAKTMIATLKDRIPAEKLPDFYQIIDKDFGGDIDAFVENIYANSQFVSAEKLNAAIQAGCDLFADPAKTIHDSYSEAISPYYQIYNAESERFTQGKKDYIAGTLEMREGEAIYPDANFTMRLTYGTVMPYSPRDAVQYNFYTTLDGVMEKEDPNNWEFEVPTRLKELWAAEDFGDYALANGKLPVAFISNLDITGGNSGSPIMNGRGELIGLAFDGNWEAMSGDIIFEPNY